jgi:hypothetical protein
MIALMMLLAQAAPSPEPVVDSAPDILVVGERLERLRFSATVKRGQVRCRITRSSGDPALDAIACPAVGECAARPLRTPREMERCVGERIKLRYDALQAEPPRP